MSHSHSKACGHLKRAHEAAEQGDYDSALHHIGHAMNHAKSARKDKAMASQAAPVPKTPTVKPMVNPMDRLRKLKPPA